MPNAGLTDITLILDRSGSMNSIKTDTIGGYNTFVEGQKAAPGEALFTLIQFSNAYEPVYQGRPIADVPPLTAETFVPMGGTALLDAMGRAINEAGARFSAMAEADRPSRVIFVILTDGEENASREFNKPTIGEMVKHQTDAYGWTFVYLGANQDAIKVAGGLGLLAMNSMTYTGENVKSSFEATSRGVSALRGGGTFGYTEADRKEAVS